MAMILAYTSVPFALSIGTFVLILGFTSQRSLLRPLGIIPMLGYVQSALHTVQRQRDDEDIRPIYMSLLLGAMVTLVLQYLDSALLSKWTYEAQGPTSAAGGQKHLCSAASTSRDRDKTKFANALSRLKFGWEEAFRSRSTRTLWEVNHVPEFTPGQLKIPTKRQFLYRYIVQFLTNLLFLDAIGLLGRDASMNSVNFAANRVPFFSRLPEVTTEEMIIRLITTLIHWSAGMFLLQLLYDGFAILVIAFNLGRLERWPPLFGRWTDFWSIRQFWGVFWHQGTRQKFLGPANFISFSVLRLRKGTLVARYTVLCLTFIISGIFHRFTDFGGGATWQETGSLRFFVMQAVGIMIEDAAQGAFRWVKSRERTPSRPSRWKRLVGVVWLLFWLFWTTPDWVYPTARRSIGKGILPFSVISWLI